MLRRGSRPRRSIIPSTCTNNRSSTTINSNRTVPTLLLRLLVWASGQWIQIGGVVLC